MADRPSIDGAGGSSSSSGRRGFSTICVQEKYIELCTQQGCNIQGISIKQSYNARSAREICIVACEAFCNIHGNFYKQKKKKTDSFVTRAMALEDDYCYPCSSSEREDYRVNKVQEC